jgi:hypothetical protein
MLNIRDLKPLSELAQRFGAKCVTYGPPGLGKTPLMATAPRPLCLVVEPGLLSVRKVTNVPGFEANTAPKIRDFFTWFFQSAEARNFDTLGIDSVSQMAEIIVTEQLGKWKDGRKAYGEMSREIMGWMNDLYYLPNKHIYLIAKQMNDNGCFRPYFPGQDLNIRVPHLFDLILRLAQFNTVPGAPVGQAVTAFQCKPSFDAIARDRSGVLAEFEFPNLTAIFQKVMAG